jgi:phage gpG-like protein
MAGTTFTIDSRKFDRRVRAAREAMSNFKPPLKESEKYELGEIKKQFSSQGSNITGGWAKRKKAYPHPILNKTGKLKGSFKRTLLTNTELHITSNVPYFKYHQLGTRKMTKRQILGFSAKMKSHITKIFYKYIRSKIK